PRAKSASPVLSLTPSSATVTAFPRRVAPSTGRRVLPSRGPLPAGSSGSPRLPHPHHREAVGPLLRSRPRCPPLRHPPHAAQRQCALSDLRDASVQCTKARLP